VSGDIYYMKKICFVALHAYPLLVKKNMGYGGGPEVLQVLLATELMKHDFEVTFVVYGEGSPLIEKIEGINVVKVPNGKRSKVLKSFLIWKAMRRTNADIYYHHSGAPGIVSLFCWINKKKFICHIASDACVTRSVKSYRPYELDIKLADIILVQSEFQKMMLMKNFNRNGILVRNFFPISGQETLRKSDPPIVLWVGAMAYVKQPWLFLKLARKIPESRLQMIGGVGDEKLYKFIQEKSKETHNIDFLGYIPFYEIDQYFKQASILVNTSKFEGYPNAFIQAWMYSVPTVSLNTDPDEAIYRCKLGFHSKTFEQLVQDVSSLIKNEQLRKEMGKNARRYVEKEHNILNVISTYIQIFNAV